MAWIKTWTLEYELRFNISMGMKSGTYWHDEMLVGFKLLKNDYKWMKWGECNDDNIQETWINGEDCTINEMAVKYTFLLKLTTLNHNKIIIF